ncbi:MAG: methyl-accepting chemotaxis protein [Defluviitaleaceae bacterium]|nr:methyl-accepting chemotaxis protein [Defluviitaleaceae bacterium]
MSFFRNMKLGVKLYTVFILMVAVSGGLLVFNGNTNRGVTYDLFLMLEHPVERYNILNTMHGDIVDSRRIVANMAFHIGDQNTLQNLRNEAIQGHSNLMVGIRAYQDNMLADEMISTHRRNELLQEADALSLLMNRYRNEIVEGMFNASSGGTIGDPISRDNVQNYLNLGASLYGQISEMFETLREGTIVTRDNRTQELVARSGEARITSFLAGLIFATAFLISASFLVRAITTPLKQVVAALGDVAKGRMDVNIRRDNISKDETGELTLYVVELIDVIRDMVYDLSNIQQEYNTKGIMTHRVDATKYENDFRGMVESINAILDDEVANIKNISSILKSIGDGNFDVKVEDMQGDFMMQTHALRGVLSKLDAVSAEVLNIVDHTANKGDLSCNIDTSQFDGSWKEIMNGLADICEAVDKPIQAWKICLNEMKAGNFDINDIDRKVSAHGFDADPDNYAGVFKDISMNLDHTISDISSYINEIEDVLAKTANGDLRNNINREYVGSFDNIKRSVNNINVTLNKTMSGISMASEQVLSGAKQISTSAQELANGAQEQASSVEELNATIDVLNQQTKQNADNASEASKLSKLSTTNAQEGNASMRDMLTAMTQIKESSGEIAKIIKAIQDIAFQTNLLALNASVEAARAGEHGRGFSVVAEEVRNLAGRSQESVNETTGLIETSNNRVESGSSIAEATSKSLDTVVRNAAEVSELINNISVSSREQAEAISQVSTGLSQISQVVQSNSAVSEETAAASEELNSQAEMLQQLVAYFKL